MSCSHFSIRSLLVLTTVVAGGTAVALAGGGGPALAYGVLVLVTAAHVLAVRIGHSVSGHTVVRTSGRLEPRRSDAGRERAREHRLAGSVNPPETGRARRAGVAGTAAGGLLALLLIIPCLGWAVHPIAVLATGCSGASLGGLTAVSIVGVCDFLGNLKNAS